MSGYVCGRCGKTGHNRRTCGKTEINALVKNSKLLGSLTQQQFTQFNNTPSVKGSVSEIYERYSRSSRPITANESDPDYALRKWERTLKGSAAETSDWFEEGKKHGAQHMLVVMDTYDYETYPVYVYPDEDLTFHQVRCSKNMQRVLCTYNLEKDKREQISSYFNLA